MYHFILMFGRGARVLVKLPDKMSLPSIETKKAFLEGHFYDEYINFFNCAIQAKKINPDPTKIIVPTYLATAFSTHARNFWEFFHGDDSRPHAWPRVNHYIKKEDWNEAPNSQVEKYYGILSKHVSHFDYGRTKKTKDSPPVAFIYAAYGYFRMLVQKFLEKLPSEYLGENSLKLRSSLQNLERESSGSLTKS